MNTTDRTELCKKLRKQLHELKTTLETTLPIVTNDIRDLRESEELVNSTTRDSRKLPHARDRDRFPEGFSHPQNVNFHNDITLNFNPAIKNLENLLKNWEIYGETIAKELKAHQQAIQQDLERRIKGD